MSGRDGDGHAACGPAALAGFWGEENLHGRRFPLRGWRLRTGLGSESARLEFTAWHFPGRGCKLACSGDDKERVLRLAQYCAVCV